MNQKYDKLKTLLKELFQLDQPDLDFGLYRVMHAKSAEVSQFLDQEPAAAGARRRSANTRPPIRRSWRRNCPR